MIIVIKSLHKFLIVKYIIVSLFTAAIEAVIGFLLMNDKGFHIIGANTFSILIGSTIHYLLISKKVFNKDYNLYTIIIYLSTFILGIVLQNIVIFYSYNQILTLFSPYLRYAGSKFLSIVIPFGVVYSIRKKLYLSKN